MPELINTRNQNPRLPNNTHRITMIGMTGSGKTLAGLWHLSRHSIINIPWIIYDYKTDPTINAIKSAQHIGYDYVPTQPGIYIVHPLPDEEEKIENHIWKIWERGSIGIFIDEAFMLAKNRALNACLMQGRSKHIPIILCTQRPAWISRFAFSESNFFQVFRLNDKRDMQVVQQFCPLPSSWNLARFHSYYFDVDNYSLFHFAPVPNEEEILEAINVRTGKRRQRI